MSVDPAQLQAKVDNVPRILENIVAAGRFQQRNWAKHLEENLGIQVFSSDEERSAYHGDPSPISAAPLLLQGLIIYDKARGVDSVTVGNGASPAPTRQPTAVQQPAPQAAPVETKRDPRPASSAAQSHPAAAAGVNGAAGHGLASYGQGAVSRAPVTQQQASATASSVGNKSDATELWSRMNELKARSEATETVLVNLHTAVMSFHQNLTALDGKLDAILATLSRGVDLANRHSDAMESSAEIESVLLGTLTLLAEQVLQAPKAAFLVDALAVRGETLDLISQIEASAGK